MSPEAVVFDFRGGQPLRRVAGLPLSARHARAAGRAGRRAVVLLVDEGAVVGVQDALRRRPPPPSLRVSVEARAPRPGEEILPGDAVYDTKLGRVGPATTDAEAAASEATLWTTIRKSIARDGIIAYHFQRPPARLLSRLLLPTRVSPNHVTLGAMVVGLCGAVVASGGGYVRSIVACALVWLGAVIDCVDGDLARLRIEGSKLGEWLDTLADDVSTMGLLLGLAVGLHAEGMGELWLLLGWIGLGAGVATTAKLYWDLHHLGLPIDTAQYPWFFGKPSESEPRGAGMVTYLFRRDAFITVLFFLCVAGLRREAFLCLFLGTCLMAVLLVVQLIVSRRPG